MIKVCIEEVGNRIITFTCEEEIEAKKLYSLLQELERLLQIFDGVFLDLEAIEIYGRESTNSYNALVEHFKIQRLHSGVPNLKRTHLRSRQPGAV